jgi:hypothetical protein
MKIARIAVLTLLLAAGCDHAQTDTSPAVKHFEGYAGLKFGMSFNEVMTQTQADFFNPYGVKDCLNELPIRGCVLYPRDNLTSALSKDGVPYGLGLAFNKFDKLTDISLIFERETTEDPEQELTQADCAAIHDRTIDWLSSEFGKFANSKATKANEVTRANTKLSNPYVVLKGNNKNSYLAFADTNLPDRRKIEVLSYFVRLDSDSTTCDIEVTFQEPDSVVRWTPDRKEQADLDRTTNPTRHPKRLKANRFPYVTPDGVDIANEQDETNWKQYGTTQPDSGE